MKTAADRTGLARFPPLRQLAVVLSVLLAASGALELHNLRNHHRAIEGGHILDQAASHPRTPHHFDQSDELHEPACATCALQAKARGVQAGPPGRIGPAENRPFECPHIPSATLSSLPFSASPRGPPAA